MNLDHNKIKITEAFGIEVLRMDDILGSMDNWIASLNYDPKESQVIEYVLSICKSRQEELCSMFFVGIINEMEQQTPEEVWEGEGGGRFEVFEEFMYSLN